MASIVRKKRIAVVEKVFLDPFRHNLTRAVSDLSAGTEGKLNKNQRRGSIRPWNLVRSGTVSLGRYFVAKGNIQLLKNDMDGWGDYWLGCRFMILSESIHLLELRNLELTGNEGSYPDGTHLLACALMLGDIRLATILLERILPISWTHRCVKYGPPPEELRLPLDQLHSYKGNPIGFRTPYNYSDVGLDPMLLRLAARRLELPLTLPDPPEFAPLGPYGPILDAWDNPDVIATTLKWMCDDRVLDSKVQRIERVCYPEPWYDVPVEILTIYRVRRDLGAETPVSSHPVLESPFDKLPENVPRLSDPLLDQAAEWARQRYPELADAVF
jgi:hypothetical protein